MSPKMHDTLDRNDLIGNRSLGCYLQYYNSRITNSKQPEVVIIVKGKYNHASSIQ
jgi:uncharacterized Fe-S cluster-containing protein